MAKAQQKQSLQFPLFLIFLQGMKRTSIRTSLPAFWRQMPTYLKGLRQRLDWKWYIHLSAAFTFWQGHCLILWDGYGYDKWPNHHMKIYHKKGTVLCVHQGLILRVEFMTCKKKFLVLLQKFFCGINMDFGLFLSSTRFKISLVVSDFKSKSINNTY